MNEMEREQAAPDDEGGAGQNPVWWSGTSLAKYECKFRPS